MADSTSRIHHSPTSIAQTPCSSTASITTSPSHPSDLSTPSRIGNNEQSSVHHSTSLPVMGQLSDAGGGNGRAALPTTKAVSGADVFAQSIADARHLCNLMLANRFVEAKEFIQPMCVLYCTIFTYVYYSTLRFCCKSDNLFEQYDEIGLSAACTTLTRLRQ